jgi:DNA polymerase
MTPVVISIDFETWNLDDIKLGIQAYVRNLRILMMAWHVVGDPAPPQLWRPPMPFPETMRLALLGGAKLSGWNSMQFERLVWRAHAVPDHGFPEVSDDSWLDSMHLAAAANLPRSLDGCAAAVGAVAQKDKQGHVLMLRVTNGNRTPWPPKEEDIVRLGEYCVQDVLTEEATAIRLPAWPDMEPWLNMPAIDRRINDRGVMIDAPLVQGLAHAAAVETARLDREMNSLTGGAVPRTTNIEALKNWLIERKVELPPNTPAKKRGEMDGDDESPDEEDEAPAKDGKKSPWRLRKGDIADLMARDDVPEECRLGLALRQEAAKASTAKLKAMLRIVDFDGRLKGPFVLGGAQQTMRWSGAAWQPHNLVRDAFANLDDIAETNNLNAKTDRAEVKRLSDVALRTAIEVGRTGDSDLIRAMYETTRKDAQGRACRSGVIHWISRMLRRVISAPQGYLLLNGDWAQVEARITVWLSQQLDVLNAFATGQDVYRVAAAGIFLCAIDAITKQMRQTGKVSTLALDFGGAVDALVAMAAAYGILMTRSEAAPIVKAWRAANRQTVAYWYATDDAAANAVLYPGQEFAVPPLGLVSYFTQGDCLCCRLPSGRLLRYWQPRLRQEYWEDGAPKDRLSLSGLTVKGRAVFRRSLYHTILVENCLNGLSNIVTCHGVKSLIDVRPDDLLWDGVGWVGHRGVVFQGVRHTIDFGGVRMTADHKVLHDGGWTGAGDGSYDDAAAAYVRYFGDPRRFPGSEAVPGRGRAPESGVADAVRLRQHEADAGGAREAWDYKKLRMPPVYGRPAQAGEQHARHVSPSRLLGLAVYVRQVSLAVAQSMASIRRSWDQGLRRVERQLRGVLGGHGTDVRAGSFAGAGGQQQGLRQEELRLGDTHYAESEQTDQRNVGHALGSHHDGRGGGEVGNRQDDALLSPEARLFDGQAVRPAELCEPVYDILNAGPRHRFTVVGADGRLIIVSNCVQAIGADMLATALGNADKAGIPVVMHVHDSVAAEVGEERADTMLPVFGQTMYDMPSWTKGLPIGVDMDASARFG